MYQGWQMNIATFFVRRMAKNDYSHFLSSHIKKENERIRWMLRYSLE